MEKLFLAYPWTSPALAMAFIVSLGCSIDFYRTENVDFRVESQIMMENSMTFPLPHHQKRKPFLCIVLSRAIVFTLLHRSVSLLAASILHFIENNSDTF